MSTIIPPSPFHDVDSYIAGSPRPNLVRFLLDEAAFLRFVLEEPIVRPPKFLDNPSRGYAEMINGLRRLGT